MGKIKILLFIIFILSSSLYAQDSFVNKGLVRAQLTLAPSKMLDNSASYFYLYGNLEGYVSDKISISGEGYYLLGNFNIENATVAPLSANHNLFFGANYHFTNNNHDFYLGIQPCVSFTKVNNVIVGLEQKASVNPVFSSLVGYHFFVNNVFHFFVQTRLILGKHLSNQYKNLNEIRFSAGLGFNLNTAKH